MTCIVTIHALLVIAMFSIMKVALCLINALINQNAPLISFANSFRVQHSMGHALSENINGKTWTILSLTFINNINATKVLVLVGLFLLAAIISLLLYLLRHITKEILMNINASKSFL